MADPTATGTKAEPMGKNGDFERLPKPFGRLTLLRQLARGGMGEVYLAAAGGIEGAERPCVVKIIRREHDEDKSFLARFLDEARIQAQLHHPGVATVLEAAMTEEGKPYVVVEHIEGRNLGEVRTRATQLGARIPWPEVVSVAICMTEALAHVHERTDSAGRPLEIVHRDLSPQNVMLGYAGDVKLIDFGTARGENRRCHTVSGIVFAKPGYVAPEVANHTPGGIPADVYAVGIMVWELLAGRRFLAGDSAQHLAAVAAGRRSPTPIAQLADSPGELDAIIAKMTASSLDERYASAREAMSDLINLLKRGPSLPDGDRSVRGRVSQLMQRLYPSEPTRTRAEFSRLVALARARKGRQPSPVPSPVQDTVTDMLAGTRYRLVREIGRGAMGVVFEAVHADLGRSLAVKVLPNDAPSVTGAERLKAEARVMARLRHENIVALHDFGFSADGRPFYAMERLEGESLDKRLQRDHVLPWREALTLGMDACSALSAAHAAGVLHRDLKPANLFVTRTAGVKLLDFGVAKVARTIESDGASEALHLIGTPEYLAPEQANRAQASERSDLYALGVVLYELLTGSLPHSAPNIVALIDAKNSKGVEPPSERAKQRGLSKMVDKTILRALDSDPDKRFESAEEMHAALDAALKEPEMKRRSRRRLGFAALGAMTLALGVGVGYGAKNPEIKERAFATVSPIFQKFRGTNANVDATPVVEEQPLAGAQADDAEAAEMATAEQSDELADDEGAEMAEADGEEDGADGTEAAEPAAVAAAPPDTRSEASRAAEQKKAEADNADLFAAAPATQSQPGDDIEVKLTRAQEMMQNGQKVRGFNEIRKLGRNHRKDARVLQAWTEAATQMKGWGEAYRVARQWAALEKSPESRVQLARLERAVGKREEAIKTLTNLLAERPGHEEARHMLSGLQGDNTVAQR